MRSGSSSIYLSGERSRKLLAGLVINANRDVDVDRLIDIVWDEDPPVTARQQIQNRLGRLRSMLSRDSCGQQIVRHGSCYQLAVSTEQVDGSKFRRLCAEAEAARQHGQTTRATGLLREGLMLWRGNAMQDIHSTALRPDAAHWEESRLRAIESVVTLEFAEGNCISSIPELQSWVAAYPYHEGLHCRLSEALHKAGRTAESLAVIRQLRHRLDVELGIAPGPAVNELEHRVLMSHDAASPAGFQLDREAAEALRRSLTEATRALATLAKALA